MESREEQADRGGGMGGDPRHRGASWLLGPRRRGVASQALWGLASWYIEEGMVFPALVMDVLVIPLEVT